VSIGHHRDFCKGFADILHWGDTGGNGHCQFPETSKIVTFGDKIRPIPRSSPPSSCDHGKVLTKSALRSRSGAQVISAGLVHSASGEAATGRIDLNLLEKICKITGGTVFDKSIDRLPFHTSNYQQFVDLTPLLLKLLLVMLLVDVCIRRWENIRGMFAFFKRDH
jgi:hypothetical protein